MYCWVIGTIMETQFEEIISILKLSKVVRLSLNYGSTALHFELRRKKASRILFFGIVLGLPKIQLDNTLKERVSYNYWWPQRMIESFIQEGERKSIKSSLTHLFKFFKTYETVLKRVCVSTSTTTNFMNFP